MKNKDQIKFESIEEQDSYLQNIPLKDLKDMEENLKFVSITQVDVNEEQAVNELDEQVMKITLKDLKVIVEEGLLEERELTIQEKVKLTGLSKEEIIKIETNKQKATLEQIIEYCKGLKIKYEEFLPDLFDKKVA